MIVFADPVSIRKSKLHPPIFVLTVNPLCPGSELEIFKTVGLLVCEAGF